MWIPSSYRYLWCTLFGKVPQNRGPRRRTGAFRPRLDVLEDRCVPTAGYLDPTFGAAGAGLVTTPISAINSGGQHLGQRVLIRLGESRRAQLHLVGLEFGLLRILQTNGLLQQRPYSVGKRLGRRRISPRVPFHRRKEFLKMSHALQYYICCQSVTLLRPTPVSGFFSPRRAAWSISAWIG